MTVCCFCSQNETSWCKYSIRVTPMTQKMPFSPTCDPFNGKCNDAAVQMCCDSERDQSGIFSCLMTECTACVWINVFTFSFFVVFICPATFFCFSPSITTRWRPDHFIFFNLLFLAPPSFFSFCCHFVFLSLSVVYQDGFYGATELYVSMTLPVSRFHFLSFLLSFRVLYGVKTVATQSRFVLKKTCFTITVMPI